MKISKTSLIPIAVLLICAVGALFYFPIPGTKIAGVDDISAKSQVTIRQTTRALVNRDGADAPVLADTVTEHSLNAEQIEMLKDFLRGNSFIRTLRSVPSQNTSSVDNSSYNITVSEDINNNNTTATHILMSISLIRGYVSVSEQSGNRCLKIDNSAWEDSILQILALSPAL